LNCKDVVHEISNYIDGELDATMKRKIEEHLGCCGDCEIVVNTTKMMLDIYCDSEPVELPQEVRTRLHEALRRKFKAPGT
jgi:anti-sigma factor RsiW